MKTQSQITLLSLIAFLSFSFALPSNLLKATYKVDTKKSKIVWTGNKVAGSHYGNIDLNSGTLEWDGKSITGGNFEMDMNSMTCTDLTDKEYNGKLIEHLKNDDFFSTNKYPKSRFVITKVTPKGGNNIDITGNLTIKDKTNEITFPATVTSDKNSLKATGKVTVNRTKYDIKYGSGSFFDNLGDKTIDDNFILDIDLVATK